MIWYGADNPETYGWAWYFECWYHMAYLEHYGLWDYGMAEKPEFSRTSGQSGGGFGPLTYVQTSPLTGEVTLGVVHSTGAHEAGVVKRRA